MPIKRDEPSGFDAITSALNVHYPDCRIELFNANSGFSQGADELLEAVGVYSSASDEPHFLFVTYGFSDLHEKESEDPAVSGYGFELTLRLRAEDSLEVPSWPRILFNTLARMVFQMGAAVRAGAALYLERPFSVGAGVDIAALLIVEDPELDPIKTANGTVAFLQIVAIRPEELKLLKLSSADRVISAVRQGTNRLLILDLNRPSLLEIPEARKLLDVTNLAMEETDGSITCPTAEWYFMTRASIFLPVSAVTDLKKHLVKRLSNGLDLTIYGNDCQIVIRPAGVHGFNIDDSVLTLELPAKSAQLFLEKLQVVPSVHTFDMIPVSIEFA